MLFVSQEHVETMNEILTLFLGIGEKKNPFISDGVRTSEKKNIITKEKLVPSYNLYLKKMMNVNFCIKCHSIFIRIH